MTNQRATDQKREPGERTPAEKDPAPMSGKRRGLSLPPRGQALSRLQDLERDSTPEPAVELAESGKPPTSPHDAPGAGIASDAVRTASSNAVNNAVIEAEKEPLPSSEGKAGAADSSAVAVRAAASSGSGGPTFAASRTASPRAAREPTTRITVDMPDSLHKRLSYLSVETRRSIKDLVIEALDIAYFQSGEKE